MRPNYKVARKAMAPLHHRAVNLIPPPRRVANHQNHAPRDPPLPRNTYMSVKPRIIAGASGQPLLESYELPYEIIIQSDLMNEPEIIDLADGPDLSSDDGLRIPHKVFLNHVVSNSQLFCLCQYASGLAITK